MRLQLHRKKLHPVMKVGGTKWYWSHGSQFLEGTRPTATGPIGWLRLCSSYRLQTTLFLCKKFLLRKIGRVMWKQ